MAEDVILSVKNISKCFGDLEVLKGISFDIHKGEKIAILGPSGSGKSTILRCINQLETYDSGEIDYMGKSVDSGQALHQLRQHIGMVFQRFNVFTHMSVLQNVIEAPVHVKKVPKQEAVTRAKELLKMVGIPSAEERLNSYPHEFSGGMRQRVMIAMALACHPKLLIADEPTTALDVTIQLQILRLMEEIQKKENTTIILVTHDLGVVAELCERVIVMYGGKIMEEGNVEDIFYNPKHPYTLGLLQSVPSVSNSKERLIPIPGSPPDLLNPPKGCPFCYRCSKARKICTEMEPSFYQISESQCCACWLQDPEVKNMLKDQPE